MSYLLLILSRTEKNKSITRFLYVVFDNMYEELRGEGSKLVEVTKIDSQQLVCLLLGLIEI